VNIRRRDRDCYCLDAAIERMLYITHHRPVPGQDANEASPQTAELDS
jgi:hypothetical protein